jgi:ABC-type nitrate/sulfonate/bicarbonate transport system ATPase subunit
MIELRGVSHTYAVEKRGRVVYTDALVDVDLEVPALQFASVVGPSGCGKTTLLRVAAGLTRPSAGEVLVDGSAVRGPGPERAVVFQSAALYPWRTVWANVRLGLELSGLASGERVDAIVERQLELVGLASFADHYPAQLSGGMQQRVGLARALAVSPPHLLMDEPFGSLDAITRQRLGQELLRLWERERRTVLFVTHSLDEALLLSDRVLAVRGGRIVSDVPVDLPRPRDPVELVEEPAFLELRRFLTELL